ncbi:MAG: triose-phosphate isomerase, partial [Holosporaceae bacterium]|nr:triose-phosphate isomerase [Holosporaceae bacterium]
MKTIIANWKMNGSPSLADRFVTELNNVDTENKIVLCPPAALLGNFRDFRYSIGAQNCFYKEDGAFTGEISPRLLKELCCEYVIVGHSERRTLFNESDEIVYSKWNAAIAQSLRPIVCIGEKLEERSYWEKILEDQLIRYARSGAIALGRTIFAYEPVWSIGTGLAPSLEDLEKIFDFIGNILPTGETDCALVYGGSVKAKNAGDIVHCKNVDGLLVGGASLDIDEF